MKTRTKILIFLVATAMIGYNCWTEHRQAIPNKVVADTTGWIITICPKDFDFDIE